MPNVTNLECTTGSSLVNELKMFLTSTHCKTPQPLRIEGGLKGDASSRT